MPRATRRVGLAGAPAGVLGRSLVALPAQWSERDDLLVLVASDGHQVVAGVRRSV
jgi:hypothetical protein